jgi:hypothetical protein
MSKQAATSALEHGRQRIKAPLCGLAASKAARLKPPSRPFIGASWCRRAWLHRDGVLESDASRDYRPQRDRVSLEGRRVRQFPHAPPEPKITVLPCVSRAAAIEPGVQLVIRAAASNDPVELMPKGSGGRNLSGLGPKSRLGAMVNAVAFPDASTKR